MDMFAYVEQTFDELYGPLIIPVALFDQQTRLVQSNQAFCSLIRSSAAEICSQPLAAFLKRPDGSFASLDEVPIHYMTDVRCANGAELPVIIDFRKLQDAHKHTAGGLLFFIDLRDPEALCAMMKRILQDHDPMNPQLLPELTEGLIKEREALRRDALEARGFLTDVLAACGDGIILMDATGRITYANDSFSSILQKERGDIVGRLLQELGPGEGEFLSTTGEWVRLDQDYLSGQIENVAKVRAFQHGGKVRSWLWYAYNRGGTVLPLEGTVSVQKNHAGQLTGFIAVFRDITDRKIAERIVQQASHFRSQFYANITHEFRTPLTLMLGPLESMLRGEQGAVSKQLSEQLHVVLANGRQLLKLVNQLLDFSMIEFGSRNFMFERRDLNKFLETILDAFSSIAKRKHIKLAFHPDASLAEVFIDAAKTEKVLFNLIGNAFKFTPERGSITVSLETVACPPKDLQPAGEADKALAAPAAPYVKITVADTGIGIKAGDIPHIFERFKRGSDSSSQALGGSGIGLAHAYEVAALMRGWIDVVSEYGVGSTFSLYVPRLTEPPEGADGSLEQVKTELYADAAVEIADVERSISESKRPARSVSGSKPLLLIVEDNGAVRKYISETVSKDYDFIEAQNGREALKILENCRPDVVLCDIMMPAVSGLDVLNHVRSNPDLRRTGFIVLTDRADLEMKVAGIEEGADDYIVKPCNSLELLARIKAILRTRALIASNERQQHEISNLTLQLQDRYAYSNIIGHAPAMQRLYQLLAHIEGTAAPVLITGETGTGKELVARAIHYNRARKGNRLVSVNCAAMPQELMEREFFGHKKGAYTGAHESRNGYFQEADGGTLFLDEIGEMDQSMQVKLLRVLERGEIIRVGDSVPIRVDVRLITATNKDLRTAVEQGFFRKDLYYRIYVLPVHVPALRERQEDIPALVDHFLKSCSLRYGKSIPPLSHRDRQLLLDYAYPGNVRELEHIIERFFLMGGDIEELLGGQRLSKKTCFLERENGQPISTRPLQAAGRKAKDEAERDIIRETLLSCKNNYSEAARQLNISRAALYKKLKKLNPA